MEICPLECGSKVKSLGPHLSKCSNKGLIGKEYFRCKHNYMHIIKKKNRERHEKECPYNSENQKKEDSDDEDNVMMKLNKIAMKKKHEDENEEQFSQITVKKEENDILVKIIGPQNDIEKRDSLNFFNLLYKDD